MATEQLKWTQEWDKIFFTQKMRAFSYRLQNAKPKKKLNQNKI